MSYLYPIFLAIGLYLLLLLLAYSSDYGGTAAGRRVQNCPISDLDATLCASLAVYEGLFLLGRCQVVHYLVRDRANSCSRP